MRIGIFADAHDHVDHVRHAVNAFNRAGCDLVLFAGDFCSPIVVPPLRKLHCRVLACFGDNDANKVALRAECELSARSPNLPAAWKPLTA